MIVSTNSSGCVVYYYIVMIQHSLTFKEKKNQLFNISSKNVFLFDVHYISFNSGFKL